MLTRTTRSGARRPARELALIAIFAGIVAALGLVPAIPVPVIPVPITAQTLGVMLAGAVLGARRGCLALLLFVALVAIGLPLLAGGRGGLGVFVAPSVGFLVGFPFAALVTGWLSERLVRNGVYRLGAGILAALAGGIVIEYAFGVAGFLLVTRSSPLPVLVFLPGDLVKAVLAALVARGVHAAYPGLLRERRRTRVAIPG
ncbi:MAG: biotin transporter BioY [Propionibacteriaceae bacterium]